MNTLIGKRVVVTRASHQAAEFERLLLDCGAIPLLYPCIEIAPPEDEIMLRRILMTAIDGAFDWLILTSTNTVFALKRQFDAMGIPPSYLSNMCVASVGDGTAEAALRILGLTSDFIPEPHTSAALAETLHSVTGKRVLLPQSALADAGLANALSRQGVIVTRVEAYMTGMGRGGVDLVSQLNAGTIAAVTFTSESTVANFVQRLTAEGGSISHLVSVCIACIGPKTVAAATIRKIPPQVMAADHTLQGLVTALEAYFNEIKMGEPQ